MLRKVAKYLPFGMQQEIKRLKFRSEIRRGVFRSPEPEARLLDNWVHEGDWVIDIGANVGHYTLALSALVGRSGRVIAFEPVPHTFELLAANTALSKFPNVTLLSLAASDAVRVVGMNLPLFDSGLQNFYQARITPSEDAPYHVMALPTDALRLAGPVALIKIDAEGHELSVLKGMRSLIQLRKPVLIVEGAEVAVEMFLAELGYQVTVNPESPNRVYLPVARSPSSLD